MIWLSGVLSQGGEKFMWGRYEIAYEEVAGTSRNVTVQQGQKCMRSDAYTIVDGQFVLTNPSPQGGNALRAGFYAIGNKSGTALDYTATSGSVLCKFTGNPSGSSSFRVSFTPYTLEQSKGTYVDAVESADPSAYPDDGIQDGYWYVKIS